MSNELKISRRYAQSEGTLDVGFGETDLDVVNNSILRGRAADGDKIVAIINKYNMASDLLIALVNLVSACQPDATGQICISDIEAATHEANGIIYRATHPAKEG